MQRGFRCSTSLVSVTVGGCCPIDTPTVVHFTTRTTPRTGAPTGSSVPEGGMRPAVGGGNSQAGADATAAHCRWLNPHSLSAQATPFCSPPSNPQVFFLAILACCSSPSACPCSAPAAHSKGLPCLRCTETQRLQTNATRKTSSSCDNMAPYDSLKRGAIARTTHEDARHTTNTASRSTTQAAIVRQLSCGRGALFGRQQQAPAARRGCLLAGWRVPASCGLRRVPGWCLALVLYE
jgi:hypothetical protein